jgi:thioesterase domain-containing protein
MDIKLKLEQLFYSMIPLTKAMGVRVMSFDGRELVLSAPLDSNNNHLGTAFGGSLNALAVLCGYGLLWLELQEAHPHIVIRASSITYDRPVRGDLTAVCYRPNEELLQNFKNVFAQKGKARIKLEAAIIENEIVAARFEGTFVAFRSTTD